MTPRMLSSTRKCCPRDFFGAARSRRREAEGRACVRGRSACSSVADVLPARLREHGERVQHVGRLVPLAAQRLRREVGAVGLGEDAARQAPPRQPREARPPSGTSRCPRTRRSSRARAPRRGAREPRSSGGSPCPESRPGAAAVSASASRVWITTGRPASAASSSWRSKSARCAAPRREVVEVVEARLADRDRPRVRRGARRARRPALASGPPAWCGSIPSAANTPSLGVGDRERRAAGRRSPSRS